MDKIIHTLLWLVSLLPLKLLYILSDVMLYPLVYYILKYRKKVVRLNINNSFPNKTEKEKRIIEKKFYHHFCDTFVETFALMHMSINEINKRITYENLDLIAKQYEKGKSVVVMTAHYANWEWLAGMSLNLESGKPLYAIYKKLRNTFFDELMSKLRSKFGGINIETQDLYRTMLRMRNDNSIGSFAMISDQSPSRKGLRHWVDFMHRKTAVYIGAEQLAKRFDYPIVFLSMSKTKRGHYHCKIEMIAEHATEWTDYSITDRYFELLEEQIKRQPELWLWSHKRWKHKYEDHVKQEIAQA